MKVRSARYALPLLAAFVVCMPAWSHERSSSDDKDRDGPLVQITEHDRIVQFDQVEWDLDLVQQDNSHWGQISVDPNALMRKMKQRMGYINVFLMPDNSRVPVWSVENLLVAPSPCPDPGALGPPHDQSQSIHTRRPPVCRYLNLRPGDGNGGQPMISIGVIVLLSAQPLPLTSRMLPAVQKYRPSRFRVGHVVINAEGVEPDPMLNTFPPRQINTLHPVGFPPEPVTPQLDPNLDLVYPICVFQDDAPNIECAKNQCVPMAQSNAIQYLEDRYDGGILKWSLPELPIPGIGRVNAAGDVLYWEPIPPYSLVANIDFFTRRNGVHDFQSGGGSTICQLYRGLFGYLTAAGPYTGAVFRHQGTNAPIIGEGNTCDTITIDLGGRVSTRDGLHPTWDWIYEQLTLGRAVTICFGRYDVDGERTSGHCVRVWGACRIGSLRYIYTLDDGNQGANNVGTRTQMWQVEDTGGPGAPGVPDGRLNMDGMSWEIEFANSIQALPTLLIP